MADTEDRGLVQYENFISVVTNIGVGNISKKTVPAERSTDYMAIVPVSKISLAEEEVFP